jgi:hypothetical protein
MLLILLAIDRLAPGPWAWIEEELPKYENYVLDPDWLAFASTAGNGDLDKHRMEQTL